jgi:hypothetical protein
MMSGKYDLDDSSYRDAYEGEQPPPPPDIIPDEVQDKPPEEEFDRPRDPDTKHEQPVKSSVTMNEEDEGLTLTEPTDAEKRAFASELLDKFEGKNEAEQHWYESLLVCAMDLHKGNLRVAIDEADARYEETKMSANVMAV